MKPSKSAALLGICLLLLPLSLAAQDAVTLDVPLSIQRLQARLGQSAAVSGRLQLRQRLPEASEATLREGGFSIVPGGDFNWWLDLAQNAEEAAERFEYRVSNGRLLQRLGSGDFRRVRGRAGRYMGELLSQLVQLNWSALEQQFTLEPLDQAHTSLRLVPRSKAVRARLPELRIEVGDWVREVSVTTARGAQLRYQFDQVQYHTTWPLAVAAE